MSAPRPPAPAPAPGLRWWHQPRTLLLVSWDQLPCAPCLPLCPLVTTLSPLVLPLWPVVSVASVRAPAPLLPVLQWSWSPHCSSPQPPLTSEWIESTPSLVTRSSVSQNIYIRVCDKAPKHFSQGTTINSPHSQEYRVKTFETKSFITDYKRNMKEWKNKVLMVALQTPDRLVYFALEMLCYTLLPLLKPIKGNHFDNCCK